MNDFKFNTPALGSTTTEGQFLYKVANAALACLSSAPISSHVGGLGG